MILKASSSKNIRGLLIAKNSPALSHLFFADDNIFFFRCKTNEVSVLKTILERYAMASGQKINFDKSTLLCSPNVSDDVKASIGSNLGVPTVGCHEKYLGLPIVVGKNKR